MLLLLILLGTIGFGQNIVDLSENRITIPTLNESLPYKNYRLPLTLRPIKYKILIFPDWINTTDHGAVQYFKGQVSISLIVRKKTNFVVLNAKDMNITGASLLQILPNNLTTSIAIQSFGQDNHNFEMIFLSLARSVEKNSELILDLTYSANIGLNRLGFYRSLYEDKNGIKSYMLTTQFSPHHARRAFPCFDEPNFKASFEISITRPGHLKSLSNMPLKESRSVSNNDIELVQDVYEPTLIMSTYLVAFIVHDYTSINGKTKSGVEITLYVPAELISKVNHSLEVIVKGLEYFESYFDIKYPLTKLDIVGVSEFYFSAMENWGLITVVLENLLFSLNETTHANRQRNTANLLHEIAHQWFGNLVTMEWWDALWLKEGLSTYLSYKSMDVLYPDWKVAEQFSNQMMPGVMNMDSKSGSHPVVTEINNPNELQSAFDTIAYDKGAVIVASLDGTVMDESIFEKGLITFLNKYAYKNCKSNDLWGAFQMVYDEENKGKVNNESRSLNIADVMSTWLNQKGFPLISISASDNQNSSRQIVIEQSKFGIKFKQDKRTRQTEASPIWQVPIKIIYGDGKNILTDTIWLKNRSTIYTVKNVDVERLWFKVNHNYSAYYVVKYDERLWKSIISRLRENISSFDPADRIQLVDNLKLLYSYGHIKLVDVLDYLANTVFRPSINEKIIVLNEENNLILMSILNFLLDASVSVNHLDEPERVQWNLLVRKMFLEPMLKQYGWSANISYLHASIRSILVELAIKCDHQPTIELARSQYKLWLQVPEDKKLLPPSDLIYATLLAAIRHGTIDDWNTVLEAYKNAEQPLNRKTMFLILGTTKNFKLLQKFLNFALLSTDQIKQDYLVDMFRIVAHNPYPNASYLAWDFIVNNVRMLNTKLGHNHILLNKVINDVASTFVDFCGLAKYQAFASLYMTKVPRHLREQTIESININRKWVQFNSQPLKQWLKKRILFFK